MLFEPLDPNILRQLESDSLDDAPEWFKKFEYPLTFEPYAVNLEHEGSMTYIGNSGLWIYPPRTQNRWSIVYFPDGDMRPALDIVNKAKRAAVFTSAIRSLGNWLVSQNIYKHSVQVIRGTTYEINHAFRDTLLNSMGDGIFKARDRKEDDEDDSKPFTIDLELLIGGLNKNDEGSRFARVENILKRRKYIYKIVNPRLILKKASDEQVGTYCLEF